MVTLLQKMQQTVYIPLLLPDRPRGILLKASNTLCIIIRKFRKDQKENRSNSGTVPLLWGGVRRECHCIFMREGAEDDETESEDLLSETLQATSASDGTAAIAF